MEGPPEDERSKQEIHLAANVAKRKPNAFTELMSRKPKLAATETTKSKQRGFFNARDGLAAYTTKPESYGSERVISYDEKYVLIHDLYPKSTVHCLVLPRNPDVQLQHPFDAFSDPEFLRETKAEVANAVRIVASELRRRFGRHSALDQSRFAAMESEEIPDSLPEGRNWADEVMVGIHAHPSMNHLHVHVLSRDMVSASMKHRKHYQTFNTPFFVPMDAFPLANDDERRHPGKAGYIQRDLLCWRCGENFGNKFAKLKVHLEEEFEKWKMV